MRVGVLGAKGKVGATIVEGVNSNDLAINAKGEILLANPAAEKMLRYRQGMSVRQLRRLSVDAAAPELRALLGEDALDEDVTRPNQLGPGRTVVLVEGVDGVMVGHSDVEHAPAAVAHA